MSKPQIEARILKGFRDYLPSETLARTEMLKKISEVFQSFGFMPIDTPALEYAEILLGKGSEETDKQMYRFLDQGERDIALRFDLTVPLARYVAMHADEVGIPFRRYHIAPVWRAEKPQRGRYREFVQCDFDIIGVRSVLADVEIIQIVDKVFSALSVDCQIRINNRLILNGLVEHLGGKERATPVLRAVDKMDKLGKEVVREELLNEAKLSADQIEQVFHFLQLSDPSLANADILAELKRLFRGVELATQGIVQLESLFRFLEAGGVGNSRARLDVGIARGLDYYTGTVFETSIRALPDIGSVCSGGRYDNLAKLYTKRDLPGVGGSVGLDRLLAGLLELEQLTLKNSTAEVLVTVLDPGTEGSCLALADSVRREGINVEIFPEVGKLGNQLKYADRKQINFVIICGVRELERETVSIKNMRSGEQRELIPFAKLAETIRSMRT